MPHSAICTRICSAPVRTGGVGDTDEMVELGKRAVVVVGPAALPPRAEPRTIACTGRKVLRWGCGCGCGCASKRGIVPGLLASMSSSGTMSIEASRLWSHAAACSAAWCSRSTRVGCAKTSGAEISTATAPTGEAGRGEDAEAGAAAPDLGTGRGCTACCTSVPVLRLVQPPILGAGCNVNLYKAL